MKYKADFTNSIYGIEGDFVATIQNFFHNDILTVYLQLFLCYYFPIRHDYFHRNLHVPEES